MAEGRDRVKQLWSDQQRRFALWAPVMIGLGVWGRLGGGVMIPWFAFLAVMLCALIAVVIWRQRGATFGVLGSTAVVLVCVGHLATDVRISIVDAPVLLGDFRGEVVGRVIETGRSRSRSPRVTLDQLSLAGVHSSAVPERARVTLVDARQAPEVGSRVAVQGILGPPAGPAAPGAFDFSEQAFFRQIGAIGYARGDVRVIRERGEGLALARLRTRISAALRARISGEAGAVAAALIVGDRSEISDATTQALRDSGLAHLLAISGLHIGLMSALTFWLVRFALALMPRFASRVAIRKIAAVAGLGAAAGYLALAGFGVATQRAFIMAAVAFGAILLDRPAVTARGLAAAACLVLLLRPESLFGAGFQMSFAAVAALIAGYEVTRPFWRARAEDAGMIRRVWTGLIATIATSVMAGAATAPFAAYHFNRLVAYGLPANVLATPVMGLWIMPAIIMTAVLTPLGLSGVGLAVLGWGVGYILWVAHWIAGLEGAAWSVPAGTSLALALIVFGGLWLVIWSGTLRLLAMVPVLLGVLLWRGAEQPDIFIAEDARLIAGRTVTGALWMSRERVSGYAAETWLRRDGDGDTAQDRAHARRRWSCTKNRCEGETSNAVPIVLLRGRYGLDAACRTEAIVIAPKLFRKAAAQPDCILIDRSILDGVSAVSIALKPNAGPIVRIAKPARFTR